jgi:hypothetical protein
VVTYSRFGSPEAMQDRFDAFAAGAEGADGGGTDCARDPSARHEYLVNGQARGEVTCYVEDRNAGLSSASSVIVWTTPELNVLARAVRGDAADLTLYEWWRTQSGPWPTEATPAKDGDPALLEGVFEMPDGTHRLTIAGDGYDVSGFSHGGPAEAQFAKPATLLVFHRISQPTFGGVVCPSYEVYRWRQRGPRLVLRLVNEGCREYASEDIAKATWIEQA